MKRPYPKDAERRRRVRIELARRDITISDLSELVGYKRPNVSAIINGRRRSPKIEARIAAFLGVPEDVLFPRRSPEDLEAMAAREKQGAA